MAREKERQNKDKNKNEDFLGPEKMKDKQREKEMDSFEIEEKYVETKRPKIKAD